MGETTPNIGIYIPAAGETNYAQAFAAGMYNLDEHDHTGAPNKGKLITAGGLAAASVDYTKLATNVADATTGIEAGVTGPANQLHLLGILKDLFQLADPVGFLAKTGAGTVRGRTLTPTANQTAITNQTGAGGDPVFSLAPTVLNATQPSFSAFKSITQNILNAATDTITFEDITLNQQFQQGTGYANPTFTAPSTGIYLITTTIQIGSVLAAGRQIVKLVINGTDEYVVSSFNGQAVKNSANDYCVTGSFILKLTATDTAIINLQNNSTQPVDIFDSTFCVALLF